MQKRSCLMAGFLTAMILFQGATHAQEDRPETGTFIKPSEMNGMCQLDSINVAPRCGCHSGDCDESECASYHAK